ncbi:hypothetical protein BKA58DRAFT_455605 [Alternaria rosae]|uniref:uncharacterized protein n=1 Tax=Alternaria rosae TaxID=1187941 RepID=UPI001E8EE1B3|nr:uncharacterized protein BKA58DRAFT_455605 [Alternaria rosae]KAH6872151.1 hypothetical protein BKA58DRAFT_455605 [Alternaria rosae]
MERSVKTTRAHKRPVPCVQEPSNEPTSPSKRPRLQPPTPEPAINNGEGSSSGAVQPLRAPIPTPPHTEDRITSQVAPPLPLPGDALLQSRLDEHRRVKVVNYMGYASGTYKAQCQMLDRDFPELQAELSMRIQPRDVPSSHTSGVLKAYIDLGIFTGPAILGLDDDRITEYIWATSKDRHDKAITKRFGKQEVERICQGAVEVAMKRDPTLERCNVETKSLDELPDLETDTPKTPQFIFEARLDNPNSEVYLTGTYRIAFEAINMDARCWSVMER